MIQALITEIFDFIVPPRPSERVVRSLSLAQLRGLQNEEGLPYHEPRVQALVWELKYHASSRAAALCGALLYEELLAIAAEELGAPLLVPVPMHPARRSERGHNQTELLCKAALRALRTSALPSARALRAARPSLTLAPESASVLEYMPHALKRITHTPTQQGLPKAVRMRNVVGSMEADTNIVEGRACIVLDDVTTTGATLSEAKRALREAGARAVHLVALARS